ncbi:unnamed protein product [Cyprideis torosa]|uniref:Uncharacterized protein n=1 Tax=Cyprideis torosa TaxID=163714 RepID=A0A7R8ZX81_9CRUS|nr:unnamed protein product [Cyprideis torosa]CAG0909934.1 unnamed protein product [Cyprideis torosa]
MASPLPPLSWLRAFEASARHLSFTHAAQELNLTQAAISKQVKLLEHFLHTPLFERKPRSLILTKTGAAYLPKVRDGFERLAAGTEEVFGRRRAQTLTLRAATGFAVNWLAPRLPDFFEKHPLVPLRIMSSVWNEPFEKERYDLDICYGLGLWQGFRADRLGWETITPLCAPTMAARLQTPKDLEAERILHVMGYQDGWANWLSAAGVTGLDAGSGTHLDTSLMAFEMAAHGLGVALGRRSMAARELASGRLVKPFDLEVPVQEAFFLLTPEIGAQHPHAETFRDWILATIQAEELIRQ